MMDFYQISHPETVQIHIVLIMNNLTIIFFVFKLNKKNQHRFDIWFYNCIYKCGLALPLYI